MADLPGGEVVVYETPDGEVRVDVRLERETVWLTQRQMAELFDTTPENVLMHVSNIFGDGELEPAATAKECLVVQTEGKRRVRRNLKHYNLDAIISVVEPTGVRGRKLPSVDEARADIRALKLDLMWRGEATELFGQERDDALAALLGNLDQSVFGEPACPTIEAKAAHLLYFVIKNLPFTAATSGSAPFFSSTSCIATGGCFATASR